MPPLYGSSILGARRTVNWTIVLAIWQKKKILGGMVFVRGSCSVMLLICWKDTPLSCRALDTSDVIGDVLPMAADHE